jgi:hypothetical protein
MIRRFVSGDVGCRSPGFNNERRIAEVSAGEVGARLSPGWKPAAEARKPRRD